MPLGKSEDDEGEETMTRWEYKVEQFPDSCEELETRLNTLGTEGWNLCLRQGIHMILRRCKKEKPTDK